MLISNAYAAGSEGAQTLTSFIPMIVIFGLFYFMLLRPQLKQAKEQRAMIAALQKGDEVVTNSGVVGTVTKVGDNFVGLEIASGVIVHVQKSSVQTKLDKGTIKSL
jgi:preprotein translocase subunit YajC